LRSRLASDTRDATRCSIGGSLSRHPAA
jgi:hypothetical protein